MDRIVRVIAVLGVLVPTGVLRTFVTSSSGQVLPERALGLGWMAAACTALAAVLWSATPAAADGCGSGGYWPGKGCLIQDPWYQSWCNSYCLGLGYTCGCCALTIDHNQECHCWNGAC